MIGWDYHCVGNIERRRQVSLQACDGAPPDRGGRLSSSVVSAPARQGAALRVSDGVVQVRVQERGLLQLLVQLDVVGLAFVDQLSEMNKEAREVAFRVAEVDVDVRITSPAGAIIRRRKDHQLEARLRVLAEALHRLPVQLRGV